MRIGLGIALCWLATAGWPVAAQQPGREPKTVEQYYVFTQAEMDDGTVAVDGLVRSKRTGNRPAELSVDVCFPVRQDGGEIDRFTAALTTKGDIASATGHSLLGRVKTEIRLKTAVKDDQVQVSGDIRYGDSLIVLREQVVPYEGGDASYLFEGQTRSALRAPNEALIKLDVRSVHRLLEVLRAQQVSVPPAQLIPGCSDHREGKQVVQVFAPPARLAALIEAVRSVKGVDSIETTEEVSVREDAVRLPDSLAQDNEVAVVDRFAAIARRVLQATRDPQIKAKPATGEHVVSLARDVGAAKALGLLEAVNVTVLVAPDPYDAKKRMLFIMQVGSSFIDPSPTPLRFDQDLPETVVYTGFAPTRLSASLMSAFAAETGGEAVSGSGPR